MAILGSLLKLLTYSFQPSDGHPGFSIKSIDLFVSAIRWPSWVLLKQLTYSFQPSDGHPGAHIDFAKRRLQLGESLYYKLLESIVSDESRRTSKDQKVDLSVS